MIDTYTNFTLSKFLDNKEFTGLWYLRIFPDFRIFFTNLPLPQTFLERMEVVTNL